MVSLVKFHEVLSRVLGLVWKTKVGVGVNPINDWLKVF